MFKAAVERSSSNRLSSRSLVKDAYKKGYAIPYIEYQKYGILSKSLWASRNQVIRIIPGYDPETGEIYRQNINCDEYSEEADRLQYLSNTFAQTYVLDRFGTINTPFIVAYEPGSPDAENYGDKTVIHSFIYSINNALNAKAKKRPIQPINEWRMWVAPGPNCQMTYDKQALLMQALVFQVNGRNNQDIDSETDLVGEDGEILPLLAVVALTNKLSIQNLVNALVEPLNPGLPLDAQTNNKYGGLAEVIGNKLYLNTVDDATNGKFLRPSVQEAGKKGWEPTSFDLDETVAKALWVPWENLLSYMTAEEQLQLCAQEFGADTVNYVIGTNPQFGALPIPDHIRQAGFGRYTALVNNSGSVTLSSQAAAPTAAAVAATPATAPSTSLGKSPFGSPRASMAPKAPEPAKKPMAPFSMSGLGGGVDKNAIAAEAARIRSATGKKQEDEQASDAAELLGESNEQ